MPARQAHGLGRQHQTHHAVGQRLARAHAVRQHQVALQLGQALVGDLRAGQLAEAGVDAIDHLVFLNDALHRGQRGLHAGLRRGVERELHATGVDAAQLRQRDMAGVEGDGWWSWCQSCLYK
jgi:hypothetical protein